ncbi:MULTISPECIES: aldose epimerase family protein [Clostridium]|jgi:aldose 1-epimerase|uniref:Aldose 1-epimerase n=2 Tax=Clostridium TaxID=1485 RepID=A0A151AKW5_9CLOT|nr:MULTISPECIES: aldose epimerase family protein [Clostridium]KYH28170.1 aldose 1-epimerase precursor [Clostridium colicanis DSM 13634]MBE6044248.1 galactose mutarotase [Clostridium thermopalmarium]PRR70571.1 Aldose 1-epimerase precursor [Clostridium thermopalmarium DSM 5974]PVZ21699.1 aldose 1-epimerase [Clostridium thermopalmarium DSM 5974]
MSILKKHYGYTQDGNEVYIFTLTNFNGITAEIINYGGIVTSLKVPDNKGNFDDIVLGYDSLDKYMDDTVYFGAIIGRYANRIENACFELNGKKYELAKNDGRNHLHGGIIGFNKVVWNAEIIKENNNECLQLIYNSKDGEEGYPGNLHVKVTYTLTNDNELKIDYFAVSDKDTIVNLTNHSYFNLSGHSSGDILNHKVMINANKFTEANEEAIPTGEIIDVKDTPMDFTKLTSIKDEIDSDYEQIRFAKGYDHNWVLNVSGNSPEKAAEVFDDKSGRFMEVYTTKPGIQFYTGNFLDNALVGKGNVIYGKRAGLCLETQYFPNSINYKNFPSPILRAGQEYKHTTIYKFSNR